MAKATSPYQPGGAHPPEGMGLLSAEAEAALFEPSDDDGDDDEDKSTHTEHGGGAAPGTVATTPAPAPGANGRVRTAVRTASTSPGPTTSAEHTPRTPHRVRFDPTPTVFAGLTPNGTATSFDTSRRSSEEERDSLDFDLDGDDDDDDDGDDNRQHRRPLLTGIEAPSVALANSDFDPASWAEEERSRPKSGLRAAFMNMANSIIGAGIIGQPYAFRQAGLLSGVILLVGLTVVVDWTICLIVVNSKLSGANSFQGTVEKCFGKGGLIAISLAQWLFAFGGMVAFGVIVGDTIPHVLQAVIPGLKDMPVLGLLADRRVVIVIFILGVSFPLTLYRDIAKVCCHRLYGCFGQGVDLNIACKSQHARPHQHDCYHCHSRYTGHHDALGGPGLFQYAASYY